MAELRLDQLTASDLPRRFARYELQSILGIGGMARVFGAELFGRAGFRKQVAIKVMKPEVFGSAHKGEVAAFIREARLGGLLKHPNIVDVYELGEAEGQLFISLEWVRGLTLSQLIRNGTLPPAPVVLEIAVGIVAGLASAHALRTEGIIVIENTGNTVWTREDQLKLGAVDDQDALFDSSDVRVWLDEGDIIAPGDRYSFVIDLLGTDTREIHTSDWQMVREGVHWFGEIAITDVEIVCEDGGDDGSEDILPLPDMWDVVETLADEHPEMLANSCQDEGGTWEFLDTLVERLRETDERWGYNWKRGVEGDPSQDVVDYHYGYGEREGSTDVYIIDVIVGHCGAAPEPGWLDQTQATADAGTIGRWTGRGLF